MTYVYVEESNGVYEVKSGDKVPENSLKSLKSGTKTEDLLDKIKKINGDCLKSTDLEDLKSAIDGAEIVVLSGVK